MSGPGQPNPVELDAATEQTLTALATARRLRIGLVADTHIPEAREELWPQVYDAFRHCDVVLHAGDVYELDVVDRLGGIAPVWVARGNGDDGSGGRSVTPDDARLAESWCLRLAGLRVGLTHVMPVPEMPPHWTVATACQRFFPDGPPPDVVVYGDTHVEDINLVSDVLCVNPGSPTFPHNLACQLGTIGFLDIVDGQASASIWQLTEDGHEPFDWARWKRPW
jgi:putative phosphoesterase